MFNSFPLLSLYFWSLTRPQQKYINLYGLFNVKSILLKQNLLLRWDKEAHNCSKDDDEDDDEDDDQVTLIEQISLILSSFVAIKHPSKKVFQTTSSVHIEFM